MIITRAKKIGGVGLHNVLPPALDQPEGDPHRPVKSTITHTETYNILNEFGYVKNIVY